MLSLGPRFRWGQHHLNIVLRRHLWSAAQVRKEFIRYFEENEHQHVPSSSLLPDDPSLLFTTAGMNQFKSIFTGVDDSRWTGLQRAVSYQKCIRAGGKHNDLDDVGKDFHHQTFFEMLGNWSFNDAYSKEHACRLAWKFLVDVMQIDPDRLYVTYFVGDSNIPPDLECKEMWKNIGVPADRILPFKEDNFWEMGFVGPCGTCTEIHYDRVPGRGNVSSLVNRDNSVVELWNIVFMSHNRGLDGTLSKLPNEHIDTGMGFERLLSVVQGVDSNFETDLFIPLMRWLSMNSPITYSGSLGRSDCSFRLVADHIRAATMAIADGALPAGTGPGFVVRKMLRRAFLHSTNVLKMDREACKDMVPLVASSLNDGYPILQNSIENVQRVIADDEIQFWKIVDKGKRVFDDMLRRVPEDNKLFPGEFIWILHDTHGVPIDVTSEMAQETGKELDLKGYEKLRTEAKNTSIVASSFTALTHVDPSIARLHSDSSKYGYTLSSSGAYVFPEILTKIIGLFGMVNNGFASVSLLSGRGAVVLEDCQFYGEEGGQKSDKGLLMIDDQVVFVVENVQKISGVTVLFGTCTSDLSVGTVLTQKIDEERRCALMRAHSATHLLNWALRRVGCGEGQRGSSVDEDVLRFDYAVGETAGEDGIMEEVEESVLRVISKGLAVFGSSLPLSAARSAPQLQSEFREDKIYPDEVRVVSVGSADLKEGIASECCTGTHVLNTASIRDFVIMGDRSSAKGVRRITALCGPKAIEARKYVQTLIEKHSKSQQGIQMIREEIDWKRVPYNSAKELNQLLKKGKTKLKKRSSC